MKTRLASALLLAGLALAALAPRTFAAPAATAAPATTPTPKPAATAAPIRPTPVVAAPAGPIVGLIVQPDADAGATAHAYLGIPYAEPVSGDKRWTAPVARAPWTETFAAQAYSPILPQNLTDPAIPRDEDALTINVWTPPSAKPGDDLPVMVWIYGGGFITGRNSDPIYDGARLAASRNVIVVNFNYRLGALGFLVVKEFGLAGNYGFLDQQLALRWVRDNISAFGGAPGKVALFGESAGSISVGLHLASAPDSRPLFRAGIMESNLLGVPLRDSAAAARYGDIFRRTLNVNSLAELRAQPLASILAAEGLLQNQATQLFHGADTFLLWTPTIDGKVLARQPMRGFTGGHVEKPFIIGTNAAEGALFMQGQQLYNFDYVTRVIGLYGDHYPAILDRYPGNWSGLNQDTLARLMTDAIFTSGTHHAIERHRARAKSSPAWAYQFIHAPSFVVWGDDPARKLAIHGDEMPFVFHTAANLGATFTPEENALSETMMTYWTNFARDLDPNGRSPSPGLPRWPVYTPKEKPYLLFETTPRVAPFPYAEITSFWDKLGYDLRAPDSAFWPVRKTK
jgi:carboxylesterase type B